MVPKHCAPSPLNTFPLIEINEKYTNLFMSVSVISMVENFMTKFTLVFLFIHVKLALKNSNTHTYMCSVLLSNLKCLLISSFQTQNEKELGKSIVDLECLLVLYCVLLCNK